MNKITVIQLLNKIANGEELPEKIIWNEDLFEYDKGQKAYIIESINGMTKSLLEYVLECDLNNEVEIIEYIEEDKEIEEIQFDEIDELTDYDIYFFPECEDDSKENFKNKINELIRNQKKIIKAVNELKKGK